MPEKYPNESIDGFWACGQWVARTLEGKRFVLDQAITLLDLCAKADRLGKNLEFIEVCSRCDRPHAPKAFSTIFIRANLFDMLPTFQWRIAQ